MNREWQESDHMDDYRFNYEKVLTDKSFTAATRLLAAELMQSPYKTVGQFFDALNDSDLEILIDKIDEENMEEILLLAVMLSRAEGVPVNGIDHITELTNFMTVFIVGESLARKGLAQIFHDEMTFDNDSETVFLRKL